MGSLIDVVNYDKGEYVSTICKMREIFLSPFMLVGIFDIIRTKWNNNKIGFIGDYYVEEIRDMKEVEVDWDDYFELFESSLVSSSSELVVCVNHDQEEFINLECNINELFKKHHVMAGIIDTFRDEWNRNRIGIITNKELWEYDYYELEIDWEDYLEYIA